MTLEPIDTGWTPVTHPSTDEPTPLTDSQASHQRSYDAARELCGLPSRQLYVGPLRRLYRDRAAREGVAL